MEQNDKRLSFYLAALLIPAIGWAASVELAPTDFVAGGWSLDAQFTDTVGSPYLLAHGLGRPVPDATANATLPEPGVWRVRVRTRNWADGAPGRFAVLIDGRLLTKTFGAAQRTWDWEDGGEVEVFSTQVRVTLRDLTGFDGRCAGLVFEKDDDRGKKKGAVFPADRLPSETNAFQFVVVGGGMPGTCAAIAAARAGVRTALVQDRPVLGGNGSAEIRVYCAGEVRHPIVDEVKGSFMNRDANLEFQDRDRLQTVEREPNLSLFLWHRVFAAEKDGDRLRRAKAIDLRTGRVIAFDGDYFCDATGDGWLGFYAGAEWRMGREAKAEFGETMAPEQADGDTLGSSVMWHSAVANRAVPFSAPWAEPYAQGVVAVNGEWNWEYGIHRNICREGEEIRDRLLLAVYGSFSLAKKDPANVRRQIVFCPFLLGKRESRRLMGDYVYSEKDVTENRTFEDAVATGSWSIDLHYDDCKPGVDFLTTCRQPMFPRYWIPFRALYSRNVSNLLMAGRCFSCTHVGLAGPRVMNTLAQCGVAVGTAVGLCVRDKSLPRDIVRAGKARELQRLIGGDWPGNPDPERADWRIVDDAEAAVVWKGKWDRNSLNHNGGQHGKTFAWSGAESVSATFPLPVGKAGRYRLMAKTPWLHSTERMRMTVGVDVASSGKTTSFVWDQNAGNGDWYELGEFDLERGAALTLNCISNSVIAADAFAVVPAAPSVCAGCAGFGTSTERKIRVACIGDSITWGQAMTNRVVECYPAQLQRLLGDRYEVRNFGDSGSCCYSHPPKAKGKEWVPHPWRYGRQSEAAYAYDPDIVVSNLGINDTGLYMREFVHDTEGRTEIEPGLFRKEYTELLQAFAKDGRLPRIILWRRLAPLGKKHSGKGKPAPFVMERDLERVAQAVGAETMDMYTPLVPFAETPHYADDGVHPEGGAQRVIAEITARQILSGRTIIKNRLASRR